MGDKNEADSELRKSLVPDQHGGSRQKKRKRRCDQSDEIETKQPHRCAKSRVSLMLAA